MADAYLRQRQVNEDISGELNVASSTDDTTLKATRTDGKHTIFIQRIHVRIITASGGKTWSIEDSAGSPISLTGALPTDSAPVQFDIDFGATGKKLTEAKNLVLNVSATGAVGIITWEGYQRATSTLSL